MLYRIAWLLFTSNLWFLGSCKVISCGGFIKSFAKIDLTKIQVKLLTTEGNLKYETECNPSNGYFMIPIYNKGVYVFKVFAPHGWIFAPESIRVDVNGVDDVCTKGEDINFSLYGFTVNGKVKSGDESGPSQFHLGLYSSNGSLVSETVTSETGDYEFKAPPGDYVVSTVRIEECVERDSVRVKVIDVSVIVKEDIKISGHALNIAVSKEDGLAFANIDVSLTSDVKLQFNDLPQHYSRPTITQKGNEWVYTLRTSAEGTAQICLPPGKYVAQPVHAKEKVTFSFSPPQATITMKNEPQKISFRVSGFSTHGRIIVNKLPIHGATILVNDAPKSESDDEGRYFLNDVKEGSYVISAKKKHYEFDRLTTELSSRNPSIPDLVAKKVEICGTVEVDGGVPPGSYVEIANEATNSQFQVRLADQGHFCELVPLGVYTITPSNDLPFVTPRSYRADLTSAPKLDVRFTQFKANVEAELACLDECNDVVIELHSSERKLYEIPSKPTFKFTELPPDTYKLKLRGSQDYCWEKDEIEFKIENADVKGLKFKQRGYSVQISSTHPASLKWELIGPKHAHGTLELQSEPNSFCAPSRGKYKISFESCHEFDQKSPLEVTIPSSAPISLKAQRAKLLASVNVPKIDKAHKLQLLLKSPDGTVTTLENPSTKESTYNFAFHVEHRHSGQEFELTPQSDTYLFDPEKTRFAFNGACDVNVVTFKAEVGKFITGRILTPLAGVNVKATHRSDASKVLTTETDANGTYKIGAVWNENDYTIEVEKEGYKFFAQDNGFDFKVVKLSQLKIHFLDSQTKKQLSEVLVSLSGANDYRSNNIIDNTGSINYIGLPPGEYFIRPILQEYKFEDNLIPIKIKEGETETVTLYGVRYAYSVFGKVTYLAGQPIPSIRVDAVSKECDNIQEEDTTDATGTYRIRGLKPECTYRVRPKFEKDGNWRSFPRFYDIKTEKADKTDIDFKLFSFTESLEVFGTAHFDGVEMPQSIRVVLSRKQDIIHEAVLHSPSTVFMFQNLSIDNQEYAVSLDSHDIAKYKFDSTPVIFTANTSFVNVKLHVRQQRKAADVEVSKSSYFGMALIVLITLAFFNQAKLRPIFEQVFLNARDLIEANMNRNQPANEQELLRRKRSKKT